MFKRERDIEQMAKLLLKTSLLALSIFISSIAYGQSGHAAMEDVINALRNGRAQDMSKYFDNFVPININNTATNYSHNQAQQVVQDFLERNPPHDFIIINSGTPSEQTKFAIGIFNTPNGRYSVYILLHQKDKTFIIKELRLTHE